MVVSSARRARRCSGAEARRRWALRGRTAAAAEACLVVQVPMDGTGRVMASLGKATITLDPSEIGRLRAVLADAQAVALADRGSW